MKFFGADSGGAAYPSPWAIGVVQAPNLLSICRHRHFALFVGEVFVLLGYYQIFAAVRQQLFLTLKGKSLAPDGASVLRTWLCLLYAVMVLGSTCARVRHVEKWSSTFQRFRLSPLDLRTLRPGV